MSDAPAYAKFEDHYEPDGVDAKSGMPKFRTVLYIRFTRPPLLDTKREAEQEDIETYSEPYKLYLKLKAGRETDEIEGYPLVLWPALSRAEFEQLASHGIITVEQLAKYADRKGAVAKGTPEAIMQLALRAKRMVDLQKNQGQYEAIITELTGERDELAAQVRELGGQLSAANALISNLQGRITGIGQMLPERRVA